MSDQLTMIPVDTVLNCQVDREGPTSPISDVLSDHFLLLQNHLHKTFLVSLDSLADSTIA